MSRHLFNVSHTNVMCLWLSIIHGAQRLKGLDLVRCGSRNMFGNFWYWLHFTSRWTAHLYIDCLIQSVHHALMIWNNEISSTNTFVWFFSLHPTHCAQGLKGLNLLKCGTHKHVWVRQDRKRGLSIIYQKRKRGLLYCNRNRAET